MGKAALTLDLVVVADALQIPENYELISAHYDPRTRQIHFLVESDELAKEPETGSLPSIYLLVEVEHCGCHKTTTRVQKGIH